MSSDLIATHNHFGELWMLRYSINGNDVLIHQYAPADDVTRDRERELPRFLLDIKSFRVCGVWLCPYKHLPGYAEPDYSNYHLVVNPNYPSAFSQFKVLAFA